MSRLSATNGIVSVHLTEKEWEKVKTFSKNYSNRQEALNLAVEIFLDKQKDLDINPNKLKMTHTQESEDFKKILMAMGIMIEDEVVFDSENQVSSFLKFLNTIPGYKPKIMSKDSLSVHKKDRDELKIKRTVKIRPDLARLLKIRALELYYPSLDDIVQDAIIHWLEIEAKRYNKLA